MEWDAEVSISNLEAHLYCNLSSSDFLLYVKIFNKILCRVLQIKKKKRLENQASPNSLSPPISQIYRLRHRYIEMVFSI